MNLYQDSIKILDNGLVLVKYENIPDMILSGIPLSNFYVEKTDRTLSENKKTKEFVFNDVNLYYKFYSDEILLDPTPGINDWLIPNEYLTMDIEEYILSLSNSLDETIRIKHELEIFKKRDLLIFLRISKFLVDIFKYKDIVYGVGRGSSVASFILYKIGVHRINSLEYDIDFSEFLE